jgi:hypothetical protein
LEYAPAQLAPAAPLPDEPATRLAAIQRRLEAIADFHSEAIPEAARPLLAELKRTSSVFLRQTIAERAAAHAGRIEQLDLSTLAAQIAQQAHTAGANVLDLDGARDVTGRWFVSATRSKVNPRYLVVGFGFQIPCGSDAGTLVYDLGAQPSRLLLALTSPDGADSIRPAYWNTNWALSPPGNRRDWLFALTRITPWCQSAGRMLQLRVVKPTDDPDAPETMLDIEVSQHLLKSYRLELDRRGLTLETHDGIDAATRRWSIAAGKLTPR